MKYLLRHKIIIALIVLLLIGFIWYGSGSESQSPLSTEETANNPNTDIVRTLLALRAVSLAGTIFTDPAFRGLKDFSTQIVPEPIGRPDPFAPLPTRAAEGAIGTPERP